MTTRRGTRSASARSGDLPDLNVWLALAIAEHPHHESTQVYWHKLAAERIWFCRVTMLGLVRLLAQPKVMGRAALRLEQAFDAYRRFSELPEVGMQPEPVDCEAQLRRLLKPDTPARLWTDAYLAAFAASAGLRLVTFDRDFARFGDVARLQLVSE
jgi:uncharacterized protein